MNWVDNAEISKTEDGNSVKVTYQLKTALITLNPDKRIAILRFKGEPLLEFVVEASHLWTSEPHGGLPTMSVGVLNMGFFKEFLHMRAQQLIFSMLSNYGPELGYLSASIRILSHDSVFMQGLKETKNEFEKRYAFFIGKQKTILTDWSA